MHQIRVRPSWMDPIVLFLKEDILPEEKSEADKVRRRLLGFGYPRTKSCTSAFFLGHTCYAYTSRRHNYSLKSYMKEFVGATPEAGLCLIEPSLKDTGGRACRKKHKNM